MPGSDRSAPSSTPLIRRVSLLSTYRENIGDDLIRAGVMHQIEHFLERKPSFGHITKSNRLSRYLPLGHLSHFPVQRMPEQRRRRTQFAGRLLSRLPGARWIDKTRNCDLFVIAGTPVFYFVGDQDFISNERIYSEDWPAEIFDKSLDRPDAPALIGLGLGSIYEGEPAGLLDRHPAAANFLRRFLHRARLVTVRDAGTMRLLECACPERCQILHRTYCPSLWAAARFGIEPAEQPARQALVGFSLESAGWSPHPNAREGRRRAFEWVVEALSVSGYSVRLVAHNDLDHVVQQEESTRLSLPAPLRLDAEGLLHEASRSRLVVTWRVHGSLAALSMGTPVLLFRTDSRSQAAEELGAEVLDDLELDRGRLNAVIERLDEDVGQQRRARVDHMRNLIAAETERLAARVREALRAGHSA